VVEVVVALRYLDGCGGGSEVRVEEEEARFRDLV
jgi:hypothetical protein